MAILGVDIGTTHCKAGVFESNGAVVGICSRPTPTHQAPDGYRYHDPETLWNTIAHIVRVVSVGLRVEAIGVASIAEAGLLVDHDSGEAKTPIIPWYDSRAVDQIEAVGLAEDRLTTFRRSGLFPSFKYALPKIMWLRDRDPRITENAVWLSAADYIVYRLTGVTCTDPSLAARTYCFRIREGVWDDAWIRRFGLESSLFAPVRPTGEPAGSVTPTAARATGLSAGTPTAVCGHDHVCAMLAGGVVEPGPVFDSMGTAESLLGVLPRLNLEEREMHSGFTIVPSAIEGRYCWLGGVRSSGGSVEWLRRQLGEEPLDYTRLMELAESVGDGPTGILFYPFLSGAGSPRPDERVRGAFIGLHARHGRGDLVRAVLEGASFELEAVRASAEGLTGCRIEELVVAGGGARNRTWLQIKADITGLRCVVPEIEEPTALGAALSVGMRCGLVAGLESIASSALQRLAGSTTIEPDLARHDAYQQIYRCSYTPFQEQLRAMAAVQ